MLLTTMPASAAGRFYTFLAASKERRHPGSLLIANADFASRFQAQNQRAHCAGAASGAGFFP